MIDLTFRHSLGTGAAVALLGVIAPAQDRTTLDAPTAVAGEERIAWFGTLESARAEAKRTNRPIFLLAARPCAGQVPGFW